jgi:hypothetical protein
MGKASSSKKVARAAKAAGKPGAGRNYAWPLTIGAIVIVGVLIIILSRGDTEDVVAPKLGDHWHAAYGIYDCGEFLPNLTDQIPDESGLHTHADGLMHMHPFGTAYTGHNANIGNWGITTGLELTDTSYSTPSIDRKNGESCGEELGESVVQLKVWDSPNDEDGRIITSDFADYAPQEFSMWVLAFVPEGTEIPRPSDEVIASLRAPSDVTGADPQVTTTIGGVTTTVPGETTTTAAGGETTTTAAGGETTTTSAPAESTTTTSSP